MKINPHNDRPLHEKKKNPSRIAINNAPITAETEFWSVLIPDKRLTRSPHVRAKKKRLRLGSFRPLIGDCGRTNLRDPYRLTIYKCVVLPARGMGLGNKALGCHKISDVNKIRIQYKNLRRVQSAYVSGRGRFAYTYTDRPYLVTEYSAAFLRNRLDPLIDRPASKRHDASV